MTRNQRLALFLVLLAACTGLDRMSKAYARQNLRGAPPASLLSDTIRIHYMENTGATLGMGSSLPEGVRFIVFVVLIGLVLAAVFGYLIFSPGLSSGQSLGLGLVISGGLGNLLDRILYQGAVIDFINLGIGPLRTGVFNVADVVVYAGMAIFVFFSLKAPRSPAA
jgi:signal peptidase II